MQAVFFNQYETSNFQSVVLGHAAVQNVKTISLLVCIIKKKQSNPARATGNLHSRHLKKNCPHQVFSPFYFPPVYLGYQQSHFLF